MTFGGANYLFSFLLVSSLSLESITYADEVRNHEVANRCSFEDAHFRTEGGGCMDDRGIVWSKPAPSTNMTYRGAREYCLELTEGGQSDWFLPRTADFRHITRERGAEAHFSWPVKFFSESFWTSQRLIAKDAGTKTTDGVSSGNPHVDKHLITTNQPNGWRTKVQAIEDQTTTWNMEFARSVILTVQRRNYTSRQPLALQTFRESSYPYRERVDYQAGFQPMGAFEPDPKGDTVIPNDRAKAGTVCARGTELDETITPHAAEPNHIKANAIVKEFFGSAFQVDPESAKNIVSSFTFVEGVIESSLAEIPEISMADLQSRLMEANPNFTTEADSQELWIRWVVGKKDKLLNIKTSAKDGSEVVYRTSRIEKKETFRSRIAEMEQTGRTAERAVNTMNQLRDLLPEQIIKAEQAVRTALESYE